jgi:hypothetical protein
MLSCQGVHTSAWTTAFGLLILCGIRRELKKLKAESSRLKGRPSAWAGRSAIGQREKFGSFGGETENS